MKTINYAPDTQITEPCFVRDMPLSVYHRWPDGISNSGLNLVARSPAHYAYRAHREPTRAMAIGTAFHAAILEPDRFDNEYIIVRDINDRRKSEYKEAAKIYGSDCTLTDNEGTSIEVMRESVMANPEARELLQSPGHAELSAFARCPETGVMLRARFDWITEDGRVLDLKKTQDCRERPFQRSVYQYRYHCQDAMYSHVYELITGERPAQFSFLAIEEQPPCANIVWTLDDLARDIGWREYRDSLDLYAESVATGYWPGYEQQSGLLSLPEWVMMQYDDQADITCSFDNG